MEKLPKIEKTDPTTFSPLSSEIKFNKDVAKRGESLIDENSGTEYFFIAANKEERPFRASELEMFVSLISKGILHVSDVVEKDGKLYSKKMPLEYVKPGEKMEAEAENFLLLYLFSDWDHRVLTEDELRNDYRENESADAVHHRNLIKDKKGSFVHYDYGVALSPMGAGAFALKRNNDALREQLTIKKIESEVYQNKASLVERMKIRFSGKTKQLFSVLDEKVGLFEDQIRDVDFFKAVVAKSKLDMNLGRFKFLDGSTDSEKIESLRQYFMERLEILKEVIKQGT